MPVPLARHARGEQRARLSLPHRTTEAKRGVASLAAPANVLSCVPGLPPSSNDKGSTCVGVQPQARGAMGQGNCCREGLLDSIRHSTVARQGRVLKRRGTKRRDGVSRGEFFGTDTAGDARINRNDYGRKQKKLGLFTSGMPCRVGGTEKARSELHLASKRHLTREVHSTWQNRLHPCIIGVKSISVTQKS